MIDPLVTLAAAALTLAATLLVISRLIPDEYDRAAPARLRAQTSDEPSL